MRQSLGNYGFASPKADSFKKPGQSEGFASPKFTRTRPQMKQLFSKKTEPKMEMADKLCFISPKKQLQCLNGGCDSSTSLASLPTRIHKNERIESNITDSRVSGLSMKEFHSTTNLQSFQHFNKTFERSSEVTRKKEPAFEHPTLIRKQKPNQIQEIPQTQNNHKFSKEILFLKNRVEELEKNNQQLQDLNKMVKEENQFLYKKMEELNNLIQGKNMKIEELQKIIREKQVMLERSSKEVNTQKKKNQQLEEIIRIMKEDYGQGYCSTISSTAETIDDQEISKQTRFHEWSFEEEFIMKCKQKIFDMSLQVKKSDIQERIIKKLQLDLENETKCKDQMKSLNKNLREKINTLISAQTLNRKSSKTGSQRFLLSSQRNRKENQEISFDLSPEKK